MREQHKWKEHAAFMNALAEEGFVVLGGPLGDGAQILLIVHADSEDAIEASHSSTDDATAGLEHQLAVNDRDSPHRQEVS